MTLILASASPRRRELLTCLDVRFEVVPAVLDETPRPGEAPEALTKRLALAKALTVGTGAGAPVLAADTVVTVAGQILGKPSDVSGAEQMLALLSGTDHRVITGVALLRPDDGRNCCVCVSRVWFRPLSDEEIRKCAAAPEALGAAGAYAIQGTAAACLARLVGSYSNVVGLPLAETAALFAWGGVAR